MIVALQTGRLLKCAAGQVRLTQWCREWVERIALIDRLNEARLAHYQHRLRRRMAAFAAAQGELKEALDGLFADAERELAGLSATAREGEALRSLVNHREGLSTFVGRRQVPMENNAAEHSEDRSSEDRFPSAPTAGPARFSRHGCTRSWAPLR